MQNSDTSFRSQSMNSHPRGTIDPDADNLYLKHDAVNNRTGELSAAGNSGGGGVSTCGRIVAGLTTVGAGLLLVASIVGIAAGAVLHQSLTGQSWSCTLLNDVAGIVLGVCCVLLVASLVVFTCVCKKSDHVETPVETKLKLCCSTLFMVLVYFFLVVAILLAILAFSFSQMGKQKEIGNDVWLDGTDGRIHVWRDDSTGLTRIHAASKLDAIFAQGYVHAAYRLWELEFTRHVVGGTLASLVGAAALKIDRQTRRLGMGRSAADMCSRASNDTRTMFQRYSDGINYFLQTNTDSRPVEFAFMGSGGARLIPSVRLFSYHEPEPFVYSDVCAAAKLIQFEMAGDASAEAHRFQLWFTNPARSMAEINAVALTNYSNVSFTILNSQQLNISAEDIEVAKRRDYLTWKLQDEHYTQHFEPVRRKHAARIEKLYKPQTPSGSSASSATPQSASSRRTAAEQQQGQEKEETGANRAGESETQRSAFEFDLFKMRSKFASNGWMARGLDGIAGGASDPHLQATLPSVWFPIRITWGGTEKLPRVAATGVSLVGMPSLGILRRDIFNTTTGELLSTIANAITAYQSDFMDLFVLNMSADDVHYTLDNGNTTLAVKEHTETIKVLFEPDETITIRSSELFGNDVTDVYFSNMKGRWGTESGDAPLRFFLYSSVFLPAIDATSADAFAATLDESIIFAHQLREQVSSKLYSPAFSIPMMDHTGTVVYSMSGRHWERWPGHTGRWPQLATRSDFFKQMTIPYAELPSLISPKNADGTSSFVMAATANQKPYPDGYKYDMGASFAPRYRAARIQTELLAHQANAGTVETSRFIQTNINSGMWVFGVQPAVLQNPQCFNKPISGTMNSVQEAVWSAAERSGWMDSSVGIAQGTWDGLASVGDTKIGFFWRTVQEFSTIFSPILQTLNVFSSGDSAQSVSGDVYSDSLLTMERALNGTADSYVQTTLCEDYLRRRGFPKGRNGMSSVAACGNNSCMEAFVVAMLQTASRYGGGEKGSAELAWGTALKPFNLENRMMSSTPLKCMFCKTVAKDGDSSTVDVSDFSLTTNHFPAVVSSSMRQVYDTAHGTTMSFAFPGGTSGYPYSKFYSNMLPDFLADKYYNVSLF